MLSFDLGNLLALLAMVAGLAMAATLFSACLAEEDRDNFVPPADNGGGNGGNGITYSTWTEVETILTDKNCANCHGSADATACVTVCHGSDHSPADTITLDHASIVDITTSALNTAEVIVDSGSSATSVLYWVVSQDSANYSIDDDGQMLGSMGPNASLTPIFTADEQATIASWIDGGALND